VLFSFSITSTNKQTHDGSMLFLDKSTNCEGLEESPCLIYVAISWNQIQLRLYYICVMFEEV